MIVEVQPLYLVWFAGIGITLLGGLIAGGRWLVNQLQQRTDQQLAILINDSKRWREVEGELTNFRLEVAKDYVRREDYARGQSVIEAKLDAVASEIKNMQNKGSKS
ncbi:TPA: hypothetical protein ACOEOC_004223 [Stenotrophomonas maltophilia]|jgi:hypothetical protein|uniref:hypothetical protein n=1 Tax=Stenotrophomonas TaxID=40323 RepID=UPI000469AD5C|nr:MULTISPECIES: hypothetical protein [Stenotrophomonas]OMP40016.1 hypothetical protein BMR86_09345 [Stenotrophomonas sp. KAs 5-3]AIL10039.1 hypothetical protein DP16_926 [Stenotrophomonas maltophilia]MBH1412090.1 hypothetical protein [Stenotrophomonas maltophilia]MBH1551032.1 hypothetical protein [Stenotrophomonas maltophilia]MBH1586918.1 hypothetical protein [Stenotrophomonas maltophilia]